MKEKPFVSKHAMKTLHAFIEKEYGADTDAVWKKTIKQYKSFVKNAPDYGGRALISPIVLISIIVEYLFFVFTAKILSSREHHVYDMVGRFVAVYYYIFAGILIIIWIKDLSVAMLLHQLSLVCVGLTVIGCVCRLWTIYIRVLKGRIRHE